MLAKPLDFKESQLLLLSKLGEIKWRLQTVTKENLDLSFNMSINSYYKSC